jgi:hypothetical protein
MPQIPLHYIFLALVAVTFVVLSDLKEAAKRVIPMSSDNYTITLRLHKFYLFLGLSFIICSGYLLIQLIKALSLDKPEFWLELSSINALSILLLLCIGIFYSLSFFNHRVLLKPNQLEITNWRGKKFTILRNEIIEFKDDFSRRKFRVYVNGKCIKVHQHMVGLATLKNWLKKPLI